MTQKLDYTKIANSCNNLSSLAEKMQSTVESLNNAYSSIPSGWLGDAADAYKEKLLVFINQMEEAKRTLAMSVLFLASCADGYKSIDKDAMNKLIELIGGQAYIDSIDASSLPYIDLNSTVPSQFSGINLDELSSDEYQMLATTLQSFDRNTDITAIPDRDIPNINFGSDIERKIYEAALARGMSKAEAILAVSISKHETGAWTSNAYNNKNNFGGLFYNGSLASFNSQEEGLNAFLNLIDDKYLKAGQKTIQTIAEDPNGTHSYCPVGAANDPNGLNSSWIPTVEKYYNEYIGGKSVTTTTSSSPSLSTSSFASYSAPSGSSGSSGVTYAVSAAGAGAVTYAASTPSYSTPKVSSSVANNVPSNTNTTTPIRTISKGYYGDLDMSNYPVGTSREDGIQRATLVAKYLVENGDFTEVQASAMVGVYLDENNCTPGNIMEAEKNGGGAAGTGGNGYGAGIASWTFEDYKNQCLQDAGYPIGTKIENLTLKEQCDMIIAMSKKSNKYYYDALRRCDTIEDASATAVVITGGVGFSKNWNTHPTAAEAKAMSDYYGRTNDARFGASSYHWNADVRRLENAKEIYNRLLQSVTV